MVARFEVNELEVARFDGFCTKLGIGSGSLEVFIDLFSEFCAFWSV